MHHYHYGKTWTRWGGGIRIKSITDYNYDNTIKSTEEYTYQSANGLGLGIMLRSDLDFLKNCYRWRYTERIECQLACCLKHYNKITFVAGSSYPQVTYEGASVLYEYITKTQYANGVPNGKTEYHYNINTSLSESTNPGLPGGKDIIDNTLSSAGRLIYEKNFKYLPATGTYKLVKEKSFAYKVFNNQTEWATNIWKERFYSAYQCPRFPMGISGEFNHLQ